VSHTQVLQKVIRVCTSSHLLKNPEGWDHHVAAKRANKAKCSEFSEDVRSEVFRTFWSEMNWDQRKVFVASNVDKVMKQRTRTEEDTSRRGHSYVYHLKNGEICKRVCKEMFLSTLCLGE